ncbi:MAG: sigma-70 family RNA polymerase sigma factor [Bacteroidota bacterium]
MTDQQLWHKLKEGDKQALRKIYDLQLEYLLQYALRLTRNEELIQDCIHDLFIEIWNRRDSLSETTAIRPYLIVALRRKLIRHLQKGQKSEELDRQGEIGWEEGVEDLLIQGEQTALQSQKLKSAMEQLSSRQKEAIFLKYYEEMDYKEVAEAMDINYQSVRNLIFNGIKKLRDILVSILILLTFFSKL